MIEIEEGKEREREREGGRGREGEGEREMKLPVDPKVEEMSIRKMIKHCEFEVVPIKRMTATRRVI